MKVKIIFLSVATLLLSCSGNSQGVYKAIQTGQKNECQMLYGDQYEKCLEKYSKPYDEYKRERDQVLEKQ